MLCPKVFNSKNKLIHHMNTLHSHKCSVCKKEFTHVENLSNHNCLSHRMTVAGGTAPTFSRAGESHKSFLLTKPQEVGQKEVLQSVTILMKEVMKESQKQMIQHFSQIM